MAISKNDCYLILYDLKNKGIDTTIPLKQILNSNSVPIEVIKFINDNRQLDVLKFYEKLRKSYNEKKSTLYLNIVKEELKDPKEVLIVLSSLNLQVLLFAKNVENREMFLNHARFSDICACLLNYSKTFDILPCIKLLKIVKADLKALESIK